MRSTVQFHAGLLSALSTGCETFVEIGPQPHLKALAVRADESLENRILISLRRQRSDWDQMLETLARLYAQGQAIDWKGFDKGYARIRMALANLPFRAAALLVGGRQCRFFAGNLAALDRRSAGAVEAGSHRYERGIVRSDLGIARAPHHCRNSQNIAGIWSVYATRHFTRCEVAGRKLRNSSRSTSSS